MPLYSDVPNQNVTIVVVVAMTKPPRSRREAVVRPMAEASSSRPQARRSSSTWSMLRLCRQSLVVVLLLLLLRWSCDGPARSERRTQPAIGARRVVRKDLHRKLRTLQKRSVVSKGSWSRWLATLRHDRTVVGDHRCTATCPLYGTTATARPRPQCTRGGALTELCQASPGLFVASAIVVGLWLGLKERGGAKTKAHAPATPPPQGQVPRKQRNA